MNFCLVEDPPPPFEPFKGFCPLGFTKGCPDLLGAITGSGVCGKNMFLLLTLLPYTPISNTKVKLLFWITKYISAPTCALVH